MGHSQGKCWQKSFLTPHLPSPVWEPLRSPPEEGQVGGEAGKEVGGMLTAMGRRRGSALPWAGKCHLRERRSLGEQLPGPQEAWQNQEPRRGPRSPGHLYPQSHRPPPQGAPRLEMGVGGAVNHSGKLRETQALFSKSDQIRPQTPPTPC